MPCSDNQFLMESEQDVVLIPFEENQFTTVVFPEALRPVSPTSMCLGRHIRDRGF